MDTVTHNEVQEIIGALYIENVLLKKKIGYLENAIEQLMPKDKGEMVEGKKEDKPLYQETRK